MAGSLRSLGGFPRLREGFSEIDTTFHRIAVPSFLNSIALKTYVPIGSAGFRIWIGTSKSGVKPFRTNSLLDWRLTKTEIGTTF
jgi:hypothetical protein